MFETIQILRNLTVLLFMLPDHETKRNPSHLFILSVDTGSRDLVCPSMGLVLHQAFY